MTKNHTTVAEIHDNDLNAAGASATYCAEDDKIRLYCGRVERETYNFLRANKFVATPKQSCDFVAVWSCKAEDIAFDLIAEDRDIEDEDYSPEERAADRAERFAGYRDKRSLEAHGHADTYDNGPSAFGNQNAARAQRQANRHERHRDRALCQWSKAEYWQTRTAGVIGNALHRSDASTRRGRILTLEADQRKATPGGRWHEHLTMRLIYENAMLENEGGTAAAVEMVVGGWIGSRQIWKINRSPVTGRIVSVAFSATGGPRNIERLGADVYRAPTAKELEAFTAALKTEKKARAATAPKALPIINPTLEDAQALQTLLNTEYAHAYKCHGTTERQNPIEITQQQYSVMSQGTYSRYETRTLHAGGKLSRRECNMWTREGSEYDKALGPALCKVRFYSGYPVSVVILTDKPQKPLPTGWNAAPVTPEPEPIPEPQEAPEPTPAAYDESHITEAAVVTVGCLF